MRIAALMIIPLCAAAMAACSPDDQHFVVNTDTGDAGTQRPYYPNRPADGGEDLKDGYAPEGYYLVWSDEFDDPMSLVRNWYFEKGGTGWGNDEAQYYCLDGKYGDLETATVSDGTLKITAHKVEPSDATDGKSYVSTRMNTTGAWQYGYIEMRAKLPATGGCWPAFWLLLQDGPSWIGDGGGELDVMEWVANEPQDVHFSCHSQNVTKDSGKYYVDPADGKSYRHSEHIAIDNPTTEYHCFGMEWTHEYIKAYLDGVQYYYAPNPVPTTTDTSWWPFDQKYYIKLNLAVGGSWGGAIDPAFSSATYEIDWVRVYQK
ncbi:MAG: glycoside hydrolase family 16 protein [Muribaculaceae bacterium]|nr:glycoside hydrolase family 16 protein [Muribaculaceae bacterium]